MQNDKVNYGVIILPINLLFYSNIYHYIYSSEKSAIAHFCKCHYIIWVTAKCIVAGFSLELSANVCTCTCTRTEGRHGPVVHVHVRDDDLQRCLPVL